MAGIIINEIVVKADNDIITTEDGQIAVSTSHFHSVTFEVQVFGAQTPATAAVFVESALRMALDAVEDSAQQEAQQEVTPDGAEQG